ncbi:hypothetical protein I2F27_09730 [Acinetobacter sp. B5B]|nr:hypothetical protein [Acinetobacter baretiae]MBF7683600.1 hypothetical protein [Acinetobacter baretiae]MBF7686039.1 hypothetical protein [Acinetobacter baretiae]
MKKMLIVFALLFATPLSFHTSNHSSTIPLDKYVKATTVTDKKTTV